MHYPKHSNPAFAAALSMSSAGVAMDLTEHAKSTAAVCLKIAETDGAEQSTAVFEGTAEHLARVLLDQGVDLEGPTGVVAVLLRWGKDVEREVTRLKYAKLLH